MWGMGRISRAGEGRICLGEKLRDGLVGVEGTGDEGVNDLGDVGPVGALGDLAGAGVQGFELVVEEDFGVEGGVSPGGAAGADGSGGAGEEIHGGWLGVAKEAPG